MHSLCRKKWAGHKDCWKHCMQRPSYKSCITICILLWTDSSSTKKHQTAPKSLYRTVVVSLAKQPFIFHKCNILPLPQHLSKKRQPLLFPTQLYWSGLFWYISQPSRQKFHLATPFLDFCVSQEKLSDRAAFLHRDSTWHLWIGSLPDLCVHSCFILRVLSLSSALMWQHFQ